MAGKVINGKFRDEIEEIRMPHGAFILAPGTYWVQWQRPGVVRKLILSWLLNSAYKEIDGQKWRNFMKLGEVPFD